MIINNMRTEINEKHNEVKILVDYSMNNEKGVLWYSTNIENEVYLNKESMDGFLIGLLLKAMKMGENIKIEGAISARLLYGLENYLIRAINNMNDKYRVIKIECDSISKNSNEFQGVGASVSGGVDSFYTIKTHLDTKYKEYDLTHLGLFNVGAFGEFGGEESRKLFKNMIKQGEIIADELSLPLIWIDSNLSEVLNEKFVLTHTFRNLSAVMVLQKLFSKYYYSSGHSLEGFKLDFSDPSNYDLLNSKAIQTEGLEFFIDGMMEGRVVKTEAISTLETTYNNLNVCLITVDNDVRTSKGKVLNCSKCFKCIRTMVTLDVLDMLETYKNVFDLKIFYDNKEKYLAELIYFKYRTKDEFAIEILDKAKGKNYKISKKVYWYVFLRIIKAIKNICKGRS